MFGRQRGRRQKGVSVSTKGAEEACGLSLQDMNADPSQRLLNRTGRLTIVEHHSCRMVESLQVRVHEWVLWLERLLVASVESDARSNARYNYTR